MGAERRAARRGGVCEWGCGGERGGEGGVETGKSSAMVGRVGVPSNPEKLTARLKEADGDGSGTIDFQE